MKTENGITMISVIIYVIGMLIVVSIVSVLTGYFYQNVSIHSTENNQMKQYTKFSSYFTQEVNLTGNRIVETKTYNINEKIVSYIIFSSGNQYTFQESNQSIYQNQIKIAENVEKCIFSSQYLDGQYEIKLEFKAGNFDKTGVNSFLFTLRN